MARIEILARFEENGDALACGSRDCFTALEAVMAEIAEKPADTTGAHEIMADDDNMSVSAYATADGYEVHLRIGDGDSWFSVDLQQ